ncbi:HpcH/HpaI aldolase/citrate lyase family protein [Aliiroseovarius sp.]|uniref:HpcH/HpaI aldolase/citrate lyase family protein n=1 Tax=Aliiroseovarius sp. TaxID=1872442 RepID=UPI003BACAF5F
MIRSYLFTPAHQEKLVARAHERGADAVLLDLEDSVPLANKAEAREALAGSVAQLHGKGVHVVVRVNRDLLGCASDLEAAVLAGVDAVMLPKVVGPDHVALVDECLSACERAAGRADRSVGLIALIETPAALLKAPEIAATPRLTALALGTEDFATECGFAPAPENLFAPAQQLILAARAAGVQAVGLPGSIAEIRDMARFAATARQAKNMGFDGVLCIHPKQVAEVNAAFAVSEEERAQAARIMAAFDQALAENCAAVELDGKMIDPPIVARAQALLATPGRRKSPA